MQWKETSLFKPNAIAQGIEDAGNKADSYITEVSAADGVKVHSAGNTSTFVQIAATFIDFVRGGVSALKLWVDGTAAKVRVGLENAGHSVFSPDGMEVYKGGDSVASFGETARIGKAYDPDATDNESHMELDYHSLQMVDKDGKTYFHVSDLLDAEGCVTDSFEGDGSTTIFVLSDFTYDTSTMSVTVNDVEVTSGIGKGSDFISFDTAPSSGSVVKVKYTPAHGDLKAYTLGKRRSNHPIGAYSVVEGFDNAARAKYAHAEGYMTSAKEDYSHAQNQGTIAALNSQTAIGKYNDPSAHNAAFVIGNGTSDDARSNAFAVDWDGNVTAAGKVNNHAARKTLWTGEFSSGSLVVDGLDQYSLVEVTFKNIATHATCWLSGSGASAYLRGANTYVSASRIIDYIVGLDATINDGYVTLSWVNCKERNMLISSQATTISDIIITSIIGVL